MAAKKPINNGLYSYSPSDSRLMKKNSGASGDYYGTGIKNPVGKVRSSTVGFNPVSGKKLKTPPKKIA